MYTVEEVAIPGVADCQHLDMEADVLVEGREAVEESEDVEQHQEDKGEDSDGEGEEESVEERWEKKESTSFVYPCRSAAGPTTPLATLQDETALDLFCRFFTDDVWQLIVDETNRYASANTASTPHAWPWSDVTIPEI